MADTIYVALLDEGIDCWRPVNAVQVGADVYRIVDQPVPEDELWEFGPGEEVRCELYQFSDGQALRAYTKTLG
jgi:hypothetical protein